jgi:hypothetical protein
MLAKEQLKDLNLNIEQVNDNISIQLNYKDKPIGDQYIITAKIGYYKDMGHGGILYADRIILNVEKV